MTPETQSKEQDAQHRVFVLQIVQPGLAGLMDGSVSTLAPVFAAAFATKSSRDAFLVGMAASIGAGISMAFAEALSDDGSLTGRGRPLLRGSVTGLMTAAGGIGHTLPFLIPDFRLAMTFAIVVVPAALSRLSGRRRRRARVRDRNADRQLVGVQETEDGREILVGQSLSHDSWTFHANKRRHDGPVE